MNKDRLTGATLPTPVETREKEITTRQLMNKLLELEKKIEAIQKKLTTPLIN